MYTNGKTTKMYSFAKKSILYTAQFVHAVRVACNNYSCAAPAECIIQVS